MAGCAVSRRIASIEASDVVQWTNSTGSDVVNNQLIPVIGATNQGIVYVALAAIANGSSGPVMKKGVVEVPAAAIAFTQGQVVQLASTSATSVTNASTAAGTVTVGQCIEAAASSAGYVKLDLNYGPSAFYSW